MMIETSVWAPVTGRVLVPEKSLILRYLNAATYRGQENVRHELNRQISTTAPENGEHAGSAFAFFFAPRWPFAATAWLDNTCPLTLEKSEAIPT